MRWFLRISVALLTHSHFTSAAILVDQPTSTWTPVIFPGVQSDFTEDEQATSVEADLVGNALYPAFYAKFDSGGTPLNRLDGELAFRMRLGGDKAPSGFSAIALVGIDGNGDGALDLFIGVNQTGSNSLIGIYNAGKSANTSPSTTSINPGAVWSTAITGANYRFEQVTLDSAAADYDLNSDKKRTPDFFLSFQVPFAQVVAAMSAATGSPFDDSLPVSYVAATSTQINSLNQDLNGVNGGTNQSLTWTVLGGLSPLVSVDGVPVGVPEPRMSIPLSAFGAAMFLLYRRRVRR